MKLTVNGLYRIGIKKLKDCCIDDAEFDARCLIEYSLDMSTSDFFIKRDVEVKKTDYDKYIDLVNRRCSGEPLQYIIGVWEFYSNSFFVGDGVLIPRPETEMLVDEAKKILMGKESAVIVDFCSGSGCIAISIAKLFPDSTVYAVEKYDKAYSYLIKNIEHNSVNNVIPVQGDIFDKNVLDGIAADLIVSNPPYIRTEDIQMLEKEVLKEPFTALDGGHDGYDFYRFLSDYWFKQYLKNGSAIALECAEDQGEYIQNLLDVFARDSYILEDFNGLQRVIVAIK